MRVPFSTGKSFLIFRIFVGLFFTILGVALCIRQSEFLGSLIAAAGLTLLTVIWLVARGTTTT